MADIDDPDALRGLDFLTAFLAGAPSGVDPLAGAFFAVVFLVAISSLPARS